MTPRFAARGQGVALEHFPVQFGQCLSDLLRSQLGTGPGYPPTSSHMRDAYFLALRSDSEMKPSVLAGILTSPQSVGLTSGPTFHLPFFTPPSLATRACWYQATAVRLLIRFGRHCGRAKIAYALPVEYRCCDSLLTPYVFSSLPTRRITALLVGTFANALVRLIC